MASLPACLSSLPVQLTQRETLLALFDNYTWSKHLEGDHFDHSDHSVAWKHPQVSVFVTLTTSLIMKVRMKNTFEMNISIIPTDLLLVRESCLKVKAEYLCTVLHVSSGHLYASPRWSFCTCFCYRWVDLRHVHVVHIWILSFVLFWSALCL